MPAEGGKVTMPDEREADARISLAINGPFPADRCRGCGWPLALMLVHGCTAEVCRMVYADDENHRRADEAPDYSTAERLMELLDFHERGARFPEVAALREPVNAGRWVATLWVAPGEFIYNHGRTPAMAMKNVTLAWLDAQGKEP